AGVGTAPARRYPVWRDAEHRLLGLSNLRAVLGRASLSPAHRIVQPEDDSAGLRAERIRWYAHRSASPHRGVERRNPELACRPGQAARASEWPRAVVSSSDRAIPPGDARAIAPQQNCR